MRRTEISTGTEQCLAYEEDGVAVMTLNRPQARNALTKEMLAGLEKALDYAERSRSVRAVIVTGAGGAFCAGGDVKSMAAGGGDDAATLDERIHAQRLSQRNTAGRMYLMPKPVIAMLPGAAAGAGLSLALAADLRTMADTAFITTAFARVGFSGDYGGTFFLSQIVGSAKAKELYFLSDRVTGQRLRAPGHCELRVRSRPARRTDHGAGSPLGGRPSGGLPLHEGKPQPRRDGCRRHRVPGPGGHPPRPCRHHRGPSRSGQGLRGEARAGVQGALTRRATGPGAGIGHGRLRSAWANRPSTLVAGLLEEPDIELGHLRHGQRSTARSTSIRDPAEDDSLSGSARPGYPERFRDAEDFALFVVAQAVHRRDGAAAVDPEPC